MAKLTKTQKKRLLASIEMKARKLYMSRVLNLKETADIERIITRGFNRIK